MADPNSAFRWSDAWLLLAVGFAAEQAPASLGAVLTVADGIQHAMMTREELNGGIGRLQRFGHLSYSGAQFALTALGSACFEQSARGGMAHSRRQTAIEGALGVASADAGQSPVLALAGEAEVITEAAYRAVVRDSRA